MADTDLPKDAAKILQRMADDAKRTGKSVAATTDEVKKLAKAYNELSAQASKSNKSITDSTEAVTESIKNYQDTLWSLTGSAMETGSELQNMFAGILGVFADAPTQLLERQNDLMEEAFNSQSKKYKKATEIKKNAEDQLKILNEQLKAEQLVAETGKVDNKDKIKSLNDQIKKKTDSIKYSDKVRQTEKDILMTENSKVKAMSMGFNILAESIPVFGQIVAAAQAMVIIFGDAYDRFVKLDAAARQFRENTGLVRGQMVEIEKAALNVNQELITQGITIEKSYAAAQALVESFSNAQTVTQNQIRAVSQLNANLGVTEDAAAGFLQKMESVGGLTEQQSIGMAGLASNAAKAAGVPINKVMKDVANASGETLAMMRGNVRQMTLAAIQANRLGVDLQKSANSAKQLLSFTESVDAEMEASVLLGKNLNLNLARQLSFQGDIAGAQAETLKQVKSMGDFNKMNMFQQEALAKAAGYTVDELSKMIKNEERLSKLKPEQLKAYESATKALKEQKEETGEQILQQAQMQSAMQQLGNTFIAFKQILADILTPIVNVAVKILIPVLKMVLAAFNLILVPVKILAKGIEAAFEPFEPVLQMASDLFDLINAGLEKVVQGATDFGKIIIKLIPGWWLLMNVVKGVGYVLIGIGRTITFIGNAVRVVSSVFGLLSGIVNPIFGMIVGSFSLIGSLISLIGRGISGLGRIVLSIGQNFKLIDIFVRPVIAVFQAINSFATRLIGPIRGIISFFGTASGMAGKLVTGLGSVGRVVNILGAFGKAVPIVGWIIAGLQGIVSMFTKLKSGTGFFKALGETLYEIFVEPFRMLFELLGKIPVIGGLFRAILPVFDVLKTIVVGTFEAIGSFFGFMWDMTKGLIKVIYDIGAAILSVIALPFKMLFAAFKLVWTLATDTFTAVKNLIVGVFKDLMSGNIIGAISKIFSFIPNLFKQAFSTFNSFVGNIFGMMFSTAAKVFGSIFALPAKLIGGLFNILAKPFSFLFETAKSVYDKIASFFTGGGGGILSSIGSAISTIFGLIFSPLTTLPKLLLGAIFSFASSAYNVLGGLFDGIFGLFNGLLDNTIGGIASVISAVTDKISGVISYIWSGIKSIASFIGGIFGFGESTPTIENKTNPLENVPSPAPAPNPAGPGTSPQVDMLAEMQKTNDKLDQLIQVMSNGGLVVNLDGTKVSEQLALASS